MKFQELIEAQRKANWALMCKPQDALEFHSFDYWYLTRERKLGKWDIKTKDENKSESSTTSR